MTHGILEALYGILEALYENLEAVYEFFQRQKTCKLRREFSKWLTISMVCFC